MCHLKEFMMNTQVLKDFSKNLDAGGFDLQAGQTWIYPTNYPIRNYQFTIVSESLYKNTLVSLPTGLGKTFIAAVVMFNFYRWFPSGKIIFMAPTKPLVKQQMEACYNIMAIPKDVTAELTGTKAQTSRKDIWVEKRVFFITPQVLQNDLNLIPELANQIKCIVIDEAHKAKGNHAYCEVLRQIVVNNKHFRVLALSATPGSTINDVTEVINNLLISHLEIRTDDSPDVMPYVFERRMETIVVPLGDKLQSVKTAYLQILEKNTRILVTNRIIPGNNCAYLTKGRIFMAQKEFVEKNRHSRVQGYGDIMRSLNLCLTLYHGYELLTRHGLRAFLNYFEEHSNQALLRGNVQLHDIMMDVQQYLGPQPSIDILSNGQAPEISPLTKFGHPKFYKLQELLLKHFSNPKNSSSRAIVFTEYKDSVKEIYALLVQHSPIIKPKYFLGQSSITQKQQIIAIKSFRSGECNTLVSTCIGEEGLDIGEVDLIVCFDISNKSPIRMVQRMGRTGRKREGKIIVLVTEGKEEEILKECLVNKHYLSKSILKSKEIHSNLFQHNPRMIPEDLIPSCQKIYISVPDTKSTNKKGKLREMFNNMAGSSKDATLSQKFPEIKIIETQDRIPDIFMVWNKDTIEVDQQLDGKISFSKRLETLRVAPSTNVIGSSRNCEILTSLLQYADSKRYNIPVSQIRANDVCSIGNKKSKFGRNNSSDNYVQRDIRTMFSKSQAPASQVITENESETSIDKNLRKHYTNDLVNELHNEISAYLSLSCIDNSNCKLCDLFVCYRTHRKTDIKIDNWIQPELTILNDINLNTVKSFKKFLNPEDILNDTSLQILNDFDDKDWGECAFSDTPNRTHTFKFELPKSAKKIFRQPGLQENDNNPSSINSFKKVENASESDDQILEILSDLDDRDWGEFNPGDHTKQSKSRTFEVQKIKSHTQGNKNSDDKEINYEEVLSFFKLKSIMDIFNAEESGGNSSKHINQSPILSTIAAPLSDDDTSPILSTFERTRQVTASRKLFESKEEPSTTRELGTGGIRYDRDEDMTPIGGNQESNSIKPKSLYLNMAESKNGNHDMTSIRGSQENGDTKPKSFDLNYARSKNEDEDMTPIGGNQGTSGIKPKSPHLNIVGSKNGNHDVTSIRGSQENGDTKRKSLDLNYVGSENEDQDMNRIRKLGNQENTGTIPKKRENENQSEIPKNKDKTKESKHASKSDDYVSQLMSNIKDFCDLSVFGLETSQKTVDNSEKSLFEDRNKDFKETSNSGSEDLFGSCSNSPQSKDDRLDSSTIKSQGVKQISPVSSIATQNDLGQISPVLSCETQNLIGRISPVLSIRTQLNPYAIDDRDVSPETKKSIANICDTAGNSQPINAEDDILEESDFFEEEFSPVLNTFKTQSQRNLNQNKIGADEGMKATSTRLKLQNEINLRKPSTEAKSGSDVNGIPFSSGSRSKKSDLTISDICDLSIFGIKTQDLVRNSTDTVSASTSKIVDDGNLFKSPRCLNKFKHVEKSPKPTKHTDFKEKDTLTAFDICDLSIFGIKTPELVCGGSGGIDAVAASSSKITDKEANFKSPKYTNRFSRVEKSPKSAKDSNFEDKILSRSSDFKRANTLTIGDICDLSIFGFKSPETNLNNVTITNMKEPELPDFNISKHFYEKTKCQRVFAGTGPAAYSVSDICDLAILGLKSQRPRMPSPKPRSQNKNTSQMSITEMLNLINDESQFDEKEELSLSTYKKEQTSPKMNNKRRLSLLVPDDDDSFEETKVYRPSKTMRRETSVKKKYRIKLKRPPSPARCDSDDDFEESPFKNNGWSRGKKPMQSTSTKPEEKEENPAKMEKKKKKEVAKVYIDDEAVLTSSDEAAFADSQSEPGSSDALENSFVNDETLDIANTTRMHAKYLQSTRSLTAHTVELIATASELSSDDYDRQSPEYTTVKHTLGRAKPNALLNKGTFKIPSPSVRREIVFSQEVDVKNDTYMNDSFCVEDDIEPSQNDELSELELAELALEEKKKKGTKDSDSRKRTKVIMLSSDSSSE